MLTLISQDGSVATQVDDADASVSLFITFGQSWRPYFDALSGGQLASQGLAQGFALAASPAAITAAQQVRQDAPNLTDPTLIPSPIDPSIAAALAANPPAGASAPQDTAAAQAIEAASVASPKP